MPPYSPLPTKTPSNLNASADVNQLQSNITELVNGNQSVGKADSATDADTVNLCSVETSVSGASDKIPSSEAIAKYTPGTNKSIPIDADKVSFWDSVTSLLVHATWANIKSVLKTYFDTIYAGVGTSITVWAPSISYSIGQMVFDSYHNLYVCSVAHTSSALHVTDILAGKWLCLGTMPGTVIYVPTATVLYGYFLCNGQTFNAATFPTLNGLLGGNTVPDLRGIFVVGAGSHGTLVDAAGVPFAATLKTAYNDHMQVIAGTMASNLHASATVPMLSGGGAFYAAYGKYSSNYPASGGPASINDGVQFNSAYSPGARTANSTQPQRYGLTPLMKY